MNRLNGLDSLMAAFGLNDSTTFQAYQKDVLSGLETQELNIAGFQWGAQQIGFTYEQLEVENQINVMAQYVDVDSPALPTGKSVNFTKLTGSIPRQKYVVKRDELDYRAELQVINEIKAVAAYNNKSEKEQIAAHLSKLLFDVTSVHPIAYKEGLNYQVGQFKSKGKLTLNDKNNPNGGVRTTFDAQVPAKNFSTKNWFTKTDAGYTEVEGSNPVADIRGLIQDIRWKKANGYRNVCVEINEKFAYELFAHSAVAKELGYALAGATLRVVAANDNGAASLAQGATFEAKKEAFKTLIGADEVIYNGTVCGVETYNKSAKKWERNKVDAFEEGVILVRPTGIIGEIKNVVPFRPEGAVITADIFDGRGIIEYAYDANTRTQTWKSEMTALAVLTRPSDMYYINGVA